MNEPQRPYLVPRLGILAALALAWLALPARALPAMTSSPSASIQRNAQGPRVGVRFDTRVLKVGGQVTMTVIAENAPGAELKGLPAIEGLERGQVFGPSQSRQISIVGGRQRVQTSTRWTVALRATKAGILEVPPIEVEVGGRRLKTRAQQLKVVEDLKGGELGFLEVVDAPERVYEGLPFTVNVRFGFDAALNVGTAGLYLPWWDELPGVIVLDDPAPQPGAQRVELGLNSSGSVRVEEVPKEQRDGRTFRVFWLRKVLMPTRAGKLEFGTSYFEFQQVLARGGGGFFRREPDKTESFYIRLEPFEIEVASLPEEGRPYDFTGAVGDFRVSRSVNRRDVDAGDSIKFSVEWSGEGNLEWFDPPDPRRLDGWEGFRVYGTEERTRIGSRRVTYDIAPVSEEVSQIPALPLWVLDPESGEYEILATEPVPIRVRAKSGELGPVAADTIGIDIRDIETELVTRGDLERPGIAVPIGLAALLPLLWLALRIAVRRHGDPDSAEARRRRAAKRSYSKAIAAATTASGQVRALDEFLAARSGEKPGAWLGRDVRRWARDREEEGTARFESEPIEELVRLRERLDEAVYAGGDQPLERGELTAIAARVMQGGL